MDDKSSTKPMRNMSFPEYKKSKLKMLRDFYIFLNEEETEYFNTLKTEVAIDNFCIRLIRERL